MLHNNCPWCGYNYKEVRPLPYFGVSRTRSLVKCGHCGNVSIKRQGLSFLLLLILAIAAFYYSRLHFLFIVTGVLLGVFAFFIMFQQAWVRYEAKDGKVHDFYEADVRIEWNERGEQNSIPFRGLRIWPGEVFVVDNAAVTGGDIKPFVIIHSFRKFTGMTRAKMRVPMEVSLENTFHLLVNGEAAATCRVEEE